MSPVQCERHGLQDSAQLCCDHVLSGLQSDDAMPASILFDIDWRVLPDDPEQCTPTRVCDACASSHALLPRMQVPAAEVEARDAVGRFPNVTPACVACLRARDLL
jgi:hypothetical protein